jgi:hypothetical protein
MLFLPLSDRPNLSGGHAKGIAGVVPNRETRRKPPKTAERVLNASLTGSNK